MRKHASLLRFVLVVAACAFPNAQGQESKVAPFSLTIHLAESEVKVGSPIWVNATIENKSDHEISIYVENVRDQGGFVYKMEAWDDKGSIVGKTKFGRQIQDEDSAEDGAREDYVIDRSGGEVGLKPKETRTDRVDVAKICVLSRPGTYTVQLRRFDLESNAFVRSNKLTVTVTP